MKQQVRNRVVMVVVSGWLIVTAGASPAGAAPVAFGSNHYEFVQVTDPFTGNNNSWANASAAAAASVFSGQNGHLATVTSQAENDFLYSLVSGSFTGFNGGWLGGQSPAGWLEGPENGQAFTYTNWAPTEPNNAGFAYMNVGTTIGAIAAGQWADDSGVQGVPDPVNDPVIGYFVEYEGTVNAVPAPSSCVLAAAGLLLLRRRGLRGRGSN